MLYIRYIGKKRKFTDHLYGTGKTWAGKGDIKPVETDVGVKLLEHSDILEPARKDEYDALAGVPPSVAKQLDHPLRTLVGEIAGAPAAAVVDTADVSGTVTVGDFELTDDELAEIKATRAAKAAARTTQDKAAEIERAAVIEAAKAKAEEKGDDGLTEAEREVARAESTPKKPAELETRTKEQDPDNPDRLTNEVNLSNLNKVQLIEHAKRTYNKDLDSALPYPTLKKAVTELRNTHARMGLS